MTRAGRPWAVVITVALCALVAAAALATAAALRDRGTTSAEPDDTAPPVTTSGLGVDGCVHEPCTVVGSAQVGGTAVQLVADAGFKSGRLRLGGAGSSEVFEATITDLGAALGEGSLQCVSSTL